MTSHRDTLWSALRSCRRLPCQRLQRESRSWAGTKLCKIRDVRSCFASVTAIGRKEDVARRCGSCTVSILMLCDGITLKIVGNFHVVPGVQYCDLGPFSDSGKSWMWLAFDCSDGKTGGRLRERWGSVAIVEICLSRVARFVFQTVAERWGRPLSVRQIGGCDERGVRSCRLCRAPVSDTRARTGRCARHRPM